MIVDMLEFGATDGHRLMKVTAFMDGSKTGIDEGRIAFHVQELWQGWYVYLFYK